MDQKDLRTLFGRKMDKSEMLERLKTCKDPVERDRLIWAISGREEDFAKPAGPAASEHHREKIATLGNTPMPLKVGGIFSYLVPGVFVLVGLINLIEGLSKLPGPKPQAAAPQFIFGIIFLLMGITGIIKARKKEAKTGQAKSFWGTKSTLFKEEPNELGTPEQRSKLP